MKDHGIMDVKCQYPDWEKQSDGWNTKEHGIIDHRS